jgi:hypothetical protein
MSLDVAGRLVETEPPPAAGLVCGAVASTVSSGSTAVRRVRSAIRPAKVVRHRAARAMSSAKPVVCSDIDGYRQVANPNGSFLVRRRIPALAEASLNSRSIRRRASASADQPARGMRYDWDQLADRVRDEYLAAIVEKRAHVSRARASQPTAARQRIVVPAP